MANTTSWVLHSSQIQTAFGESPWQGSSALSPRDSTFALRKAEQLGASQQFYNFHFRSVFRGCNIRDTFLLSLLYRTAILIYSCSHKTEIEPCWNARSALVQG